MAAPCTEHLFFTGRKGVGKSTLVRAAIEGKRAGGFFTRRVEGVLERPSVHLLRARTADVPSADMPSVENFLFYCGSGADIQRFDKLGCGALADAAGCEVLVMDELGPHEEQAAAFRQAVLRALEGDVPIVGVLQQAESPFLRQVASHPNVRVVTVTEENRDALRLWLAQRR